MKSFQNIWLAVWDSYKGVSSLLIPQFLANQLGPPPDYAHWIILASPDFQTFLRPWYVIWTCDSSVVVVTISLITKLRLLVSHDDGLGKQDATYMKDQLLVQLLHDIHMWCKLLHWYTLRSNHHHHSYTMQCWFRRCRYHCQSNQVDHHNLYLHSKYILYNIGC